VTVIALPGSGKTQSAITYLTGAIRDSALDWRKPYLGILMTPLMGNLPVRPGLHAHDNGVWSEFTSGKPFNLERFLAHLDNWSGVRHMCLFATAPDVVGNWWKTLERSKPVLPQIRARGYRAALVAQDGLDHHLGRVPWDDFDVLFLGGGQSERYLSDFNRVRTKDGRWVGEWKLTPGAARLVAEARRRGKDVHMGRVNSFKRISYAQSIGCTSADGMTIARHPKGVTFAEADVRGWLDQLNPGKPQPASHCYICRWKVQALLNTYRHMTVDSVLKGASCDHGGVGAGTSFAPQPAALPLAA